MGEQWRDSLAIFAAYAALVLVAMFGHTNAPPVVVVAALAFGGIFVAIAIMAIALERWPHLLRVELLPRKRK